MTPDELRNAAAVMLAAAEGREIEGRMRGMGEEWRSNFCRNWNWYHCEFRVKPEPPAHRPFANQAEAEHLLGAKVRHKESKSVYLVVACTEVLTQAGQNWMCHTTLFERYEQLDGTPCGVLE